MPIIGLCIIMLLTFVGIAVDMGRYFLVRNKLLTALDAALLGAADIATNDRVNNNPQEIIDRGRQFFRANFPTGYLGTNISDENIIITVDTTTGTVAGEIQGAELPLVFGGIYGIGNTGASAPTLDINVFSEVVREVGTQLEIALVLDYTPSMCFELGTGSMWGTSRVYNPSCPKFEELKTRTLSFINQIEEALESSNSDETKAYYSYIPFSHSVRVDGSLNNFNFCADENKERLPSLAGLRDDPASIEELVQSASVPTEGGSNVATGMWWGWSSLRANAESVGLFSGISGADIVPADLEAVNDQEVQKIIILLTDGENEYPNRRCDNNFEILSGDSQGFQRDFVADDRLSQLCEGAKGEGIKIYAIAFDVPETSTTATLLRGCANPGQYYNANNFAVLETVFNDIANELIDLRITK